MTDSRRTLAAALVAILLGAAPVRADQSNLIADTDIHGPVLNFDWPAISVGVGSYEEGPTGVTVIRFGRRVSMAVDSRGGAPGTVNTDALRLGYERPFTDAVVFAGGSSYGEEAITAVQSELKEPWRDVAFVPGAIIYDLGSRRLNEVYPDKDLALTALAAVKPGVFPLGAQGAGRMAMQGGFFGCNAHSGQGAAFRQVGDVKIAAFVVVNAGGAVTDRDGRLVRCHKAPGWSELSRTSDLLQHLPQSTRPDWRAEGAGPSRNTTVSLIVTNRKLDPALLQRLAVQVHMSMGRAIQPFSTAGDGDTLFAASTQEIPDGMPPETLSALAGEVMWDAVLASVPDDPAIVPPATPVTLAPETLAAYAGTYDFAAQTAAQSSFGGVGLELDARSGATTLSPAANGPAARAGVQNGDVLAAVDGVSLKGLLIEQIIAKVRGPVGTTATLSILRSGHDGPLEIKVTRELVHEPLLHVSVKDGALWVEPIGGQRVFEFPRGQPTRILPLSQTEFYLPGRYGTRLGFVMNHGKSVVAVLNPGRWQQQGLRIDN